MKRLTSLITYLILAIVTSQSAYANGTITDFEIKEIWAGGYTDNSKPTTRIALVAPHNNPGSCRFAHTIVIYSSQPGIENHQNVFFEQQYAAALTALVNGNKLDAYLVGCTLDGKFALANRLTIKRKE